MSLNAKDSYNENKGYQIAMLEASGFLMLPPCADQIYDKKDIT